MPPSMIWEIGIGSFGVAAAVLLVGGWVVLRFYRDRQQFALMQAALERGIAHMPGAVPGWLISYRQGVLALVVGLGLVVAGAVLAASAAHIDEIPASVIARVQQLNIHNDEVSLPPMYMPHRPPSSSSPPPPHRGLLEARWRVSERGRGIGRRWIPEMERWHRVETQRLMGILGMCVGGILGLMGVVRVVFARAERRYALDVAGGGGGVRG